MIVKGFVIFLSVLPEIFFYFLREFYWRRGGCSKLRPVRELMARPWLILSTCVALYSDIFYLMTISSSRLKPLKPALIGAVAGYFALHLYAMLAYSFYQAHMTGLKKTESFAGIMNYLGQAISTTFNPGMLYMGIPFGLLGAAAGLFFGYWRETERIKDELEKRECAIDAIKQLTITLSHYLLNASTVIGGYASHISRDERDPGHKEHLESIREESEKIEAVVKSLQSLKAILAENYGSDYETMIIDIKKQVEDYLINYQEKTLNGDGSKKGL